MPSLSVQSLPLNPGWACARTIFGWVQAVVQWYSAMKALFLCSPEGGLASVVAPGECPLVPRSTIGPAGALPRYWPTQAPTFFRLERTWLGKFRYGFDQPRWLHGGYTACNPGNRSITVVPIWRDVVKGLAAIPGGRSLSANPWRHYYNYNWCCPVL